MGTSTTAQIFRALNTYTINNPIPPTEVRCAPDVFWAAEQEHPERYPAGTRDRFQLGGVWVIADVRVPKGMAFVLPLDAPFALSEEAPDA